MSGSLGRESVEFESGSFAIKGYIQYFGDHTWGCVLFSAGIRGITSQGGRQGEERG